MARFVCVILSLVASLIFLIIGIAVLVGYPIIYRHLTLENVVLANKNMGFNLWKQPPYPIYFQAWVWNVTNSENVTTKGEKPYLVQRGPYTYREIRNKEDVDFNTDDEYISYISPQIFEFVPEMSVGDPKTENITTINIPYLTVANSASFMTSLEQLLIQIAARRVHSKVYDTFRVFDLLWGYTDPLLEELHKEKPDLVPTTFFGLFMDKNNTDDGVYEVNSGKTDASKTAVITSFRNRTNLNYWTTDTCNMINGTDGTYYPPFLNKNKPLYIFSSDICRSIKATFEKTVKVLGVPAYRYVGPPEVFQNATENPANIGFCTPNEKHCLPGGLLNVSNCHEDAPVVMSLPHFLYSEGSVLDMVQGEINPVKEEHQTAFDLEPNTGAPMQVFKRLQINVYQKSYPFFVDFAHLSSAYVPIVWINESSVVPEDQGSQFRWLTVYPRLIATVTMSFCLAIGVILGVLVLVIAITSSKKRSGNFVLINEPTEKDRLLGK